ncbi:organic cation/carnitine transporter 7-like [Nicotiana tabacum]|uniref:Organic cation/carnitine transporter 7-like n=1 Tax=Nicotiana tabacum TaxID=4097 RepID=A0A1S3X209_TOBAC|nr:organic cation/carnitine transporter 7 [Nicotiana tomentosiformis]XP_016433861.1 PREDICTED: organic cation/carnitine transporter 7-like [Nicotiana tabacum]
MAQQQQQEEEDEFVYTLDEALTSLGFGKFQYMVLVYAGLGSMVDAVEVMILSFIGPALKSQWGLSSTQESLITTVVFSGMLIGAYLWGLVADNYGRRKGLLTVAIVTTISAFLSSFSPNYISLLILRMLVGIGLGGGPVYGSWFLEFVPSRNRGTWMVIYSTFWTIGTILEALLAMTIMPSLGWRWLLALSSIPSFAALFLYTFTVESPRYLCAKGRISDAHDILRRIAIVNKTKLPPGILVTDQVTHELNEELLSPGKNKISNFKTGLSSFLMLLSPRLRRITLLTWVVYFGNSFSYYGIILLTSQLSAGENRCFSVALHAKKDTGLYRDVFITSLAELPGLLFSVLVVEKVGRKFSMALMYVLGFLFLFPLVVPQNEVLSTVLLFGARIWVIGTFTLAGVYCPEIYPTSVRTTGCGVASSVGRIAGMVSPLVAVHLVRGCHQMAAIILFEVVLILSAISVLLFPVETKGRELVDHVSL